MQDLEEQTWQAGIHIWDKIFLCSGLVLGSISLANIKDTLQIYLLLASCISITLAIILHVIKIQEKKMTIKMFQDKIKDELNKKC